MHQSKLHMEGFQSLKDGEAVEFTFKKSAKGLNLSESPALVGCSVLGARGGPKGRTCRSADQRETGATTVEV